MMVLLDTSEEWQRQSSLLLQARPTTTRITTKYNVPNLESLKYQRPRRRKTDAEMEEKDATLASRVPRAMLTLKTYDPESGVCLKFKTDRAAEVGRLINGLGRLGRHMAAVPQETEDTVVDDATLRGQASNQEGQSPSATPAAVPDAKVQQPTAGGAAKRKKKGKK